MPSTSSVNQLHCYCVIHNSRFDSTLTTVFTYCKLPLTNSYGKVNLPRIIKGCTIFRLCAPNHTNYQIVTYKYNILCLVKNEIQWTGVSCTKSKKDLICCKSKLKPRKTIVVQMRLAFGDSSTQILYFLLF